MPTALHVRMCERILANYKNDASIIMCIAVVSRHQALTAAGLVTLPSANGLYSSMLFCPVLVTCVTEGSCKQNEKINNY